MYTRCTPGLPREDWRSATAERRLPAACTFRAGINPFADGKGDSCRKCADAPDRICHHRLTSAVEREEERTIKRRAQRDRERSGRDRRAQSATRGRFVPEGHDDRTGATTETD